MHKPHFRYTKTGFRCGWVGKKLFFYYIYHMKKNTFMKKLIVSVVFFASLLSTTFYYGCKKEDDLNPEEWVPQNFWVKDIGIFEKEFTWDYYGSGSLDGFKIDRKVGKAAWVNEYEILSKESRSWEDRNLIPNPANDYVYRIYAFRGDEKSNYQTLTTRVVIETPKIVSVELMANNTSCKIIWEHCCEFVDGFAIDRKFDDGNWEEKYAIVQPNQTEFIDTNVFWTNKLMYRIYTIVDEYHSAKDSMPLFLNIDPPETPMLLRPKVNQIDISWTYNDVIAINGYKVKRKYKDGDWQLLSDITDQSYTDTSFEIDTLMTYGIFAYKGKFESIPLVIDFNSEIPTPESEHYVINSLNSVSFNWEMDVEGFDGYVLERSYDNGGWTQVAAIVGDVHTVEDNSIVLESCTDGIYSYRLSAHYQGYYSVPKVINMHNGAMLDERDGNLYESVLIGNQCWLQRNLAWLPSVSPVELISTTDPYYYVIYYSGTDVDEAKSTQNYKKYGVLYNYPAALTACPDGWHLSSEEEWNELAQFCGGFNIAGEKLKEEGYEHWFDDEYNFCNGSDDYNFTALPGAYKNYDDFGDVGIIGTWWCNSHRSFMMLYQSNTIEYYAREMYNGFSVRCIKNE